MKKPFCDVCGEPAIDNAYESAVLDENGARGNRRFCNISASVLLGESRNVKSSDPYADICRACFAKGLRQLADKVEGTVTR